MSKETISVFEAVLDGSNNIHGIKNKAIQKHLYKALHLAGYYRGLLEDVNMLKNAFKSAKNFTLPQTSRMT